MLSGKYVFNVIATDSVTGFVTGIITCYLHRGIYVFALVCLSVSGITQRVVGEF